jgi:glycosyltransferase involved in cell wall biosynthesis
MRVAFVMPGVGVVTRGAEAFVVELCARLAATPGFEVHLFGRGPAAGDPGGSPVTYTRIRALRRDQPLVQAVYGATRAGRKVLDTLFLDPLSLEWYTAALAAMPHLWSGGFDAVVMEGGLVGAWLCRLLRRLRGVPFVDIAHGLDLKWETAFARQRPDRVVTFTAAAAAMLRARVPAARLAVIPHGIDLELFRPPAIAGPAAATGTAAEAAVEGPRHIPDTSEVPPNPRHIPDAPEVPPELARLPRPRILCVGAVDEHKRMRLAVEAVARLAAGGSLTVLGEGPEAAALDRLAAERLGAGRYLRRVVPRAEMPAWYRGADCFTLPSRSESFGLVYLEALACGRPVVAPDDAVRREVIGDAGVLCDVGDAHLYSQALAAALARDWGGLPRRRAERFPIAATVRAYAEMLTSLRPSRPGQHAVAANGSAAASAGTGSADIGVSRP